MSSDATPPAGRRASGPFWAVGLLALAAAAGSAAEPPRFQFTRLVAHWDQYADPAYRLGTPYALGRPTGRHVPTADAYRAGD
jgi:hypothetical protein